MRKKALIFYISEYSGHFQAARAIEKGLLEVGGEVEVEKINALGYTNPILGSVINKTYLEIIKKKPEIWGQIYDNPSVMKKTRKARDVLHKYNMAKIRKLLDSYSPDVVICTQAFPRIRTGCSTKWIFTLCRPWKRGWCWRERGSHAKR